MLPKSVVIPFGEDREGGLFVQTIGSMQTFASARAGPGGYLYSGCRTTCSKPSTVNCGSAAYRFAGCGLAS